MYKRQVHDVLDLAADGDERVAEAIELVLRLTLGRLDHHRAGNREGHRRGVEAVVHQPLRHVLLVDRRTRAVLLEVASELGVPMDERPLREDEAKAADEVFITSTTREISPVAAIDDRTIGDGRPGPISLKLWDGYHRRALEMTAGAAQTR